MRFTTVYAAAAALLFSSAMAAPLPAPAAIAAPGAVVVERQLLPSVGSTPSDGANGNGNGNGNKQNGVRRGMGERIGLPWNRMPD